MWERGGDATELKSQRDGRFREVRLGVGSAWNLGENEKRKVSARGMAYGEGAVIGQLEDL